MLSTKYALLFMIGNILAVVVPSQGRRVRDRRRLQAKVPRASRHGAMISKGKGGKGKGSCIKNSSYGGDVKSNGGGRFLSGKSGEGCLDVIPPETEQEEEAAGQPMDDSNDGSYVERFCDKLAAFNTAGNQLSTSPTGVSDAEWSQYCEHGSPPQLLCPNEYEVQKICMDLSLNSSDSTLRLYCNPMVSSMGSPSRDDCALSCTNYVASDRGDCCDITCP